MDEGSIMADMKTEFNPVVSPVVGTYSFSDLAEGTNFMTLYAFRVVNGAGFLYKLSQQAQWCEDTKNGVGAEYDGKSLTDVDFDLAPFGLSQEIEGTMRCQIPTYYTGGASPTYAIQIKLRKWDGSTETEIANVTSDTYTAGEQENFIVMDITVPRTYFAAGDVLRVSILTSVGGSPTPNVHIAISPQNDDTTNFTVGTNTPTTVCKFDVPVKINK